MSNNKLNIGIILGSTREGRVSPQVGTWVKSIADKRQDAVYEIVDIKAYQLPLLGTEADSLGIVQWGQKLASLDAFVFVVSEYNHSISASLKNALDLAKPEWINKSAGIVSYGSAYGARAAEHLRGILGELQIADVRNQVLLSLFIDFDSTGIFKPHAMHEKNVQAMLDQVVAWGTALKTLRR